MFKSIMALLTRHVKLEVMRCHICKEPIEGGAWVKDHVFSYHIDCHLRQTLDLIGAAVAPPKPLSFTAQREVAVN